MFYHRKTYAAGLALAVGIALAIPAGANATELMPSFANVPTGWSVDRYAPNGFADVGTVAGRSDVLGIDIGPNGDFANRPAGYQFTFYNTQGDGHLITGGAGDSLSAGLYVSSSWRDPSLGARRTDMWGVMTDGTSTIAGYPIIGFTNNDTVNSFVGFRTWDDTLGVWHDLSASVNYDAWNDLSILFTGTSYEYFVNGALADTIAADSSATTFSETIMQAYNFADPAFGNSVVPVVANDYRANWSNIPVPEPSSLASLAGGLGFLGFAGLVAGVAAKNKAA